MPPPLHVQTPMIYSPILSIKSGCQVYLKLESGQPSGSFKSRGLGALARDALSRGKTHFVTSSGGNAGLAAAYSAMALAVQCSVYVPSSTPEPVQQRLRMLGAQVIPAGNVWDEADKEARKFVESNPESEYLPPFDHEMIMKGHSTMVEEMYSQWKEMGHADDVKPDAILCSVGGGGLLGGILEGCSKTQWKNTTILACETEGTASFNASMRAAYRHVPPTSDMVTLDKIRSIANTLGARTVSKLTIDRCITYAGEIKSLVMSDARAIHALKNFADDHKILVEPHHFAQKAACSVSLAPLYDKTVLAEIFPTNLEERKAPPKVVVIVCGGSGASISQVTAWEEQFKDVLWGECNVTTFIAKNSN